MNYSVTSPVERFFPISEATLLFGYRTEVDAAPSFMPHGQRASYPAYTTSQRDPRFHLTEPSLAEGGSSSFLSAASIPPTSCSTWGDAISGDISPSMSPPVAGPSESSTYDARQDSTDRGVVANNQSITPHERERKIRGVFPCTTVSAPTGEQAIPVGSHPEHVVSWYLTCWNAVILSGPRKFVPQTIYQPQSQGDKDRYVSLAKLQPPIVFLSQDSPEWGVPISHLLSKRLICLVEGDEPAFASSGPSIGIRVQWPGYKPCHKQVSTRDYTSKRRMINRAKLAKVVARCVKQFMDTMSEQTMQVGSDRQWRVGPFDIKVDDIILVSLHHVSQGSWQPQLRLRKITGTDAGAGSQGHHGY